MSSPDFLTKIYRYYMRRDGTVVSAILLLDDAEKLINSVVAIIQGNTRLLIFDPSKWQVKSGVNPHEFGVEGVKMVYLPFSQAKNGEDIPADCLNSLEPKPDAEVAWPKELKTKWDLWIRADCPD